MLGEYMGGQAEKSSSEFCRPDPEKLLQAARERLVKMESGLKGLRNTAHMPINVDRDGDKSLLALIGSVTVSIWREEENVDRILKEIDSAK